MTLQDRPKYSVYKTKNPKTGKKYPKWRYKFIDWDGREKRSTGCLDRQATIRIAEEKAKVAYEIRAGMRPVPAPFNSEPHKPIQEHISSYIEWGKTQGGRGGRPWSDGHLYKVSCRLKWWIDILKLKTLNDITLAGVEKALQEKDKAGVTGKTLFHYASVLKAFVSWCVDRKFLENHILEKLGRFDITVSNPRRAMTPEEIGRLLNAVTPLRRMIYQIALVTGFRARELASLRVGDFNPETCTLHLKAEYAKDRQFSIISIPKVFADDLRTLIRSKLPDEKLFSGFALNNQYRNFDKDLRAAGIEKHAFGGKLDFHALRTAHVNLGLAAGFDAKTAQVLARHKTVDMTMNTYGRASKERLRQAVEILGGIVKKAREDQKSACFGKTLVQGEVERKAAGAESLSIQEVSNIKYGGGEGNRTPYAAKSRTYQARTGATKYRTESYPSWP